MINIRLSNKPLILRIIIVIFSLAIILLTVRSLFQIITTLAPDFSVFWTSTHDLINYRNPYTNPTLFTINAYPPSTFIYFIPLALIPYKVAQGIFVILSFLTIPGIVLVSLKTLSKKVNLYQFLLFLSLVLISFPTKFTLGMGQVNLVAFLILLSSFYFYKEEKPEMSGIFLGAACLLKPALGFILLLFVLKRKWKVILYSFLVPALATILIASGFGINPFVYWVKEIIPQLSGIIGREVYYNQGIMGFISRLTPNLTTRVYLNTAISIVLILFTSFFTLKVKKNENLQFALFVTALLLVDTLSWQHHFVWLIFPFILLAEYASRVKKTWFWVLLFLAYLLVSWNFKTPQAFSVFPTSLVLSNTHYGAIIVYLLTFWVYIPLETTWEKLKIQGKLDQLKRKGSNWLELLSLQPPPGS